MSDSYKAAMGQMTVEPGQPDRNLSRAVGMIEAAARAGCRLIVLPECLDLGWTHPSARELALPIPGDRSDVLAEAARRTGIYVAAGLTERREEYIHNSAILLRPDGLIALHHRKINELDIAADLYTPGSAISVVHTAIGTIGMTICADNFPDSIAFAESLAQMGAQVLVSPCAWAVDADHDNTKHPYGQLWLEAYVPLTRRFPVTILGVSNTGWITAGPWKGRKCIGCSLAVGPGGAVLARGPYGEEADALLIVDVELGEPWKRSGLATTSPCTA